MLPSHYQNKKHKIEGALCPRLSRGSSQTHLPLNPGAWNLVGAKPPGHTACAQGGRENEHIQHPGQDCDSKPTSTTEDARLCVWTATSNLRPHGPVYLTAQQPSVCRKQRSDCSDQTLLWWAGGARAAAGEFQPHSCLEAGAPTAAQAASNYSNPSASASWAPGYRCASTPSCPLSSCVLHVPTGLYVSSLKVCVQLFSPGSSLTLGLSRSRVHSGYWSCFMCIDVGESFPILELTSSDFPVPFEAGIVGFWWHPLLLSGCFLD